MKRRKKLIYTITFNPALDYVIQTKELKIGEINRGQKEYIMPGGKGINVSIVLKTLGIQSTVLGFVAGFVGEEIEKKVKEYGIRTDFIQLKNNNSRINVKITTASEETAINGKGPNMEESDIQTLYQKIEEIKNGDILVLSGSIPKGISENIYQNICKKLETKDIKIIVDATGDLLVKTLKYHPFLIKPNQEEVEEIFNCKISNQEEATRYAKKLQQMGAKNVLVSMGSQGAILLDENGYTYKRKAFTVEKRKNTVGAGDSMVAGFIAGYQLYNNYEKALEMGMVAATATANSMFLATKEEIEKLWRERN